MRSDIVKVFDAHIDEVFKTKPDVAKFVKNYERKGICIDRLCEQIEMIERRTFQITFDMNAYKKTIQDVATMFAKSVVRYAEEQNLSSIEKIRRETEANKDKQVQEMIDGWKKEGALIDNDPKSKTLGADNGPQDAVERDA